MGDCIRIMILVTMMKTLKDINKFNDTEMGILTLHKSTRSQSSSDRVVHVLPRESE
jgi:hypothetical protein